MRQHDNLEQLYRERYKDLETIPREDLWAGIAARLPEKKKRDKIIPLWYRFAGAAAVISLLAVIGVGYYNSMENPVTKVVYIKSPQGSNFIDVASEEFEQNMQNSAEMLKTLRESTLVLQSIQQVSYPAEEIQQNGNSLAETTYQTENSIASITNYQEEQIAGTAQEKTEVSEKLKISLQPETEVAGVESELKDLSLEAGKEDLLKDIEARATREKRFQLKTTAAAVYFDNLGRGSAIDNQLAGNEGGGDISFSYGIAVAYKISDKLSVRSGINKVDLSYNTRDVSYGTAVSAMALGNNEARAVSLASPVTGNINQSLGFVEVPLELKYGLINKKVGLNVIGGASTLFLNENNITLEAGNATTSFGEAGNLNDVSFTTNIGLGVDYNISPQFQINIEPIFKYQINTFTNTSDVKPYYFGIYSGLSFRF